MVEFRIDPVLFWLAALRNLAVGAAICAFLVSGVTVAESPRSIMISGDLPDGGDCTTLGIWNGSVNRCDIVDLVLRPGDHLLVENAALDVDGLEIRQAQIENGDTVFISGRFLNTGTVTNHESASLFIDGGENRGTIDNAGQLIIFDELRNAPAGLIQASGGVLNSNSLGAFQNSGTVIVDQTWTHDGLFENTPEGTFIINTGGSFWSELSRILINRGRWDNNGTVHGFGWTLENHGVFNNHGTLSTCDDFGVNGTIDNGATVNNFGNIVICGTAENTATINNSGQIADSSANPGGTVQNSGTIANCGSLTAALVGDPATPSVDDDGDGYCNPLDCLPADAAAWSSPGEARLVRLSQGLEVPGVTRLDWTAPQFPGGLSPLYDVVSSAEPDGFLVGPGATCVEYDDGADLTATDVIPAEPGETRYYLIRASNPCGAGTAGTMTGGAPRLVRDCP